jgi:protein-S-isoprenylcysteine O-methyltransferase Ste14
MRSLLPFRLTYLGVPVALVLGCLAAETADSHPAGWLVLALSIAYLACLPFWKSIVNATRVLASRTGGSAWLLLSGALAVLFGAPLEHLAVSEILPGGDALYLAGAACAAAGTVLGVWAQAARRRLGQAQAQTARLMALLRRGPYRVVRYPGYSALLLAALGVALGYGSAVALASLIVLLLPGLVLRISVEERQTLETLGTVYVDYTRETQRLVPRLW